VIRRQLAVLVDRFLFRDGRDRGDEAAAVIIGIKSDDVAKRACPCRLDAMN
jgi:hypothetical protein